MNYNRKELIRSFYATLDPDQQRDWLRARRACDKSLYYFVKDIGGSVRKAGGDISPVIHREVLDWWQDPAIIRKFSFWPRGTRKTTVLTMWSDIRDYLLNNEIRILIPSEKVATASEWLKWMEGQILTNRRLRWLYPELSVVDRAYTMAYTWSGDKCLLPRLGTYPDMTFTVIGVRGSRQGGHFDIINPDDIVGEKGMESGSVLEDAMRWFDNCDELLIQPDKDKPKPSIIRGVGTHWANGDFGHYVQRNYLEYEWRIIPALKSDTLKDHDNIKYVQNPDAEAGESNWPEVFSTKYYVDMKANPEKVSLFWSQHMNNPQEDSGLNKFDRKWLRYFHWEESDKGKVIVSEKEDGSDGEKFLLRDVPLFGCIDPGGFAETKMIKKGSRNVILIGGQPRTSIKKFIVFLEAKKMKHPSVFLEELFRVNDEFRPRAWNIDTIGPGQFMYKTILEERSKRHKVMPMFPFDIDVSKNAKDDDIQSLIPPGANGEIYIHENMKEFIGEWIDYPNGMTKDALDMAGKLNKTRWSRHVKQKETDPLAEFGLRARQEIQDGRDPITGY